MVIFETFIIRSIKIDICLLTALPRQHNCSLCIQKEFLTRIQIEILTRIQIEILTRIQIEFFSYSS